MKKLLSILLATAILLFSGLLPVAAENIVDKDDSRLDIGEIFGYYYTVTFIDGEREITAEFERNTEIDYPAPTAVRGGDRVWSLSESEYSPVPTLMPEEDVTVYAYTLPYVGFENYPEITNIADSAAKVSDDYYYSGEKSLKLNFQSSAENGEREHSIALGNVTTGNAYKISFKYYISSALNADYYIDPYTGFSDILSEGNETDGMRVDYTNSRFTVTKDSATGQWLDGTVYFTADEKAIGDYNYVYLWLKASEYNSSDAIYFDNITTEEMVTADFTLISNVTVSSTNGVLNSNVFTAYYETDAEITPPVVTTADGTSVTWIDAEGNTVTSFVAGGVYYIKTDSKGDLNIDGAVSTLDLALIKLYLVESIDASEINVANADINANDKVDIVDMAYLKLYLAGIIENL